MLINDDVENFNEEINLQILKWSVSVYCVVQIL